MGVGDVDSDGSDDFVIGSIGTDVGANDSGSIVVYSGHAGTPIYTLNGSSPSAWLGYSVAGVGDVNGDSIPDIAIGAVELDLNGPGNGKVYVVSGNDGTPIWVLSGDSPGDVFGSNVAATGDLNGDGFADFMVAAWGDDNTGLDTGMVRVYSGFDASILYTFNGAIDGDHLGISMSSAGDVNADGVPDFMCSARNFVSGSGHIGKVDVYSGATGAQLYSLLGTASSDFGCAVSDAGDLDGDGFDDFAISSKELHHTGRGILRIYSGQTGAIIHEILNPDFQLDFARSIDHIEDFDGDGVDDLIVGMPQSASSAGLLAGVVRIISGATGHTIASYPSPLNLVSMGTQVASIGDTNGDGLPDFIAGGTYDNITFGNRGYAYVFAERPSARRHHGDVAGIEFGRSVAGGGDFNNDGYADVVVGAPQESFLARNEGTVSFISGKDNSILCKAHGKTKDSSFGTSVDFVGDINGDGHDDVIVGAPTGNGLVQNSGYARVISGKDQNTIFRFRGMSAGDHFGHSVGGAGDANLDGTLDFIVGAPEADTNGSDSGRVRVFSGLDGTTLHTFDGSNAGDLFGQSVAGDCDLNGDGHADFIIGIPGDDTNGADAGGAIAYSGFDGSMLHDLKGMTPGGYFGTSVRCAGDVNRDGYSDFIIGEPASNANGPFSGRAYVFSGVDGATLHTVNGQVSFGGFGWSVDGAGDLNRDGYDDFIVGGYADSTLASSAGSATVFSGFDGAVLSTYYGDHEDARFGWSVSTAGDVDGDGFPDIVVGANGGNVVGADSGSMRVITSPTLPLLHYDSAIGNTSLYLDWLPDNNDVYSLTGALRCTGATPGALGLVGSSLAPADLSVLGISLLIANDTTNLVFTGGIGFDFAGHFVAPSVTRQYPSLIGSYFHIQFFETSPGIRASNGVRLEVAP